ncbi:PREDICTED: focadhesin [Thamnophis sirtalis]|uniref:Focadhesin n=1 Tax=Thamnophis sirtalis TaxID=35019 RepID=A0A6I9XCC2_9SAUR|nr:PREDICTED: focadhesin [Thamnophis sirtalis]
MSEEIRKRLDFPNTLIQSQAVGHLIAAVLKENVLSNKISQSSNQTPALNLLWEKSCSDNMMVRTTCCEAVVKLVKQDHAEFGYILNTALSLIPSARNVQGLIKIIVKLLQMQALKTSQSEEQQQLDLYAIRNSPHPLIIIVENRPDCWPFLLQHMTTFFQQCPKGAERACVNIMRPFLRYLYCEPYQLREHAELRMSLLRVLLQPYGPFNKEEPPGLECHLLQLFCDLVPYYQVKDALQITEALLFLEGLFRSLLRYPSFWKKQLCHLCLQLLVFCEVSLQATGECSSLIRLMEENVELLKEGFPFQMTIIGLGVLLLQIPASQQKPILNLAIKLLSGSETKMTPLMAVILVMPALQILSSTTGQDNMIEENDSTTRQQLAINLLEIVQQEELKEQPLVSWEHYFPINSTYGSLHVTWQLLWLLRDKTAMLDWLSSIKSMLPIATQVSVHVVLLVAYLLIQENGDNLHSVLDATIEIAKVDSSQVPNLIPVLMFKLGRPLEATLCRDILYTLPALGVHKVCVAQILRVLQVLGNTPKLQAVTLRLMTCLWEKQDRVYPELQRFMAMSDMASLSVSKDTQWEKVIAKAASIRDICKQRPYQHGADMLAAISKVLNECTKPDQATPAALVLQGLHALCQAEVVCIRSTWNALSPKLNCDTRPFILKTLNELFSLVPSLMVNSSEYEKFKAQVVSFLWSHTQSKDSLVAISAYKSLSEFHPEEYTILHLPEQKSYSGENTASAIARSCAATSLSLLVPVFIVSYKERVEEVLNLLIAMLPGKPNADESQAVQIHMSLALGMFISRLCEEKVSDVADKQMNLLLMKSLEALEDCCFDTSLEYNTGCILGVGLVLSLMSHSNLTDSEAHISTSLRKLCKYLDDAEDQSRTLQEILAYTIACVCVSAFSTRIVEATEAEDVMDKLQKLTEMNQQTPGFALALGSLVHGLSICGHGKADVLSNKLFPAWMKTVLAEGAPTMQRLAAVNGLVSLVGSESTMIQLKSEAIQSSHFQSKLNEVIRTLTQVISFSGVIGLQVNAAWMLGHLYLSNVSATRSRTSVPSDFSYLPEKSFLRATIDFIIEGGKKGPEQVHPSFLKAAMAPIALIGGSYQYPPLNWASILAPLLRLDFGEEIQQLCIELAVTQAQSSQNAAMILGMWVAPPLVYSLSIQAKRYLFASLPLWMKYVAEDKQQIFTEVFMVQHFETKKQSKNPDLCWNILQGLSQAMKLPSPTQHSWSCFCKAAEKIFELLPDEIWQNDVKMYILAAKCLSEMVDTEVERITEVSKNNLEKVAFVRVYLVSQGRFPLLRWNDVISVAAGCQQKETIVWMLLHSFYHARILSHENTGVLKRMEWLLEFMGYIKKVSLNTASMQNVSPQEAVSFLLWIFAACVVAWADHALPMLLGLSADWSAWQCETIDRVLARGLGKRPVDTLAVKEILTLLPGSLQILLTKEPWKEQTPKFIDWLFSLMENANEILTQSSRDLLKASLLALRSLPEFKKKAVWTKAYGW